MALKKLLTTVGMSAAAVVTSFAVASPALAYDTSWKTDDGDPGGVVYWTANGDVVKICDIEADGWATSAQVFSVRPDGLRAFEYQFYVGGNGSCADRKASEGATFNLPEDRKVFINLCLMKDDWARLDYCDSGTVAQG
ncbi:hypothetical protein AB0K04_19830 [Micromonospora coxensis]|uniref:hypothetical protein n=1 Tax=Micromonospora coxensis TaxID=356852 RepID=UPI003435CE88